MSRCLLHWSRLQKGIFNIFNGADFKKIHEYAIFYEENIFKSKVTYIETCIYGLIKYETQENKCAALNLLSMTVPLVDSRQTKDVKARKQRMAELMNMLPDIITFILNNLDIVTKVAYDTLIELNNILKMSIVPK